MNRVDHVRQQVMMLGERKPKITGDRIMIRCPVHKGGQETNPSCSVWIGGERGAGSFRCYSCQAKGKWEDFCSLTGARPFSKDAARSIVDPATLFDQSQIYDTRAPKEEKEDPHAKRYDRFERWPAHRDWRNIAGGCVRAVGGLICSDTWNKIDKMFLPVKVLGNEGGVYCNIKPVAKGQGLNYVNMPGGWAYGSLFPLDIVREMLDDSTKRGGKRIVHIGEGPRDGLNPLQYGVPSLINFGTAWNQNKSLIMARLEPDIVLSGFDPDRAGQRAAATFYNSFATRAKIIRLKMAYDEETDTKLEDPGDMPEPRLYEMIIDLAADLGNKNQIRWR